MNPIKFREEHSNFGTLYYEAANDLAHEVMDFISCDSTYFLTETRAERIFNWLEKMGHEIVILESREHHRKGVG